MIYRRQESFRYNFLKPVYCLIESNNKRYDGQILNLSPNGLKLETFIDISLLTNLCISFNLNNSKIVVYGTVRWKKNLRNCVLGLQLENDQTLKEQIIKELKQYVKKLRKAQ
jgi:hypothetical protein